MHLPLRSTSEKRNGGGCDDHVVKPITGQTNQRCLRQSSLERKAEGSTIGLRIPSLSFGDPKRSARLCVLNLRSPLCRFPRGSELQVLQ
jgi:hypothetical protein